MWAIAQIRGGRLLSHVNDTVKVGTLRPPVPKTRLALRINRQYTHSSRGNPLTHHPSGRRRRLLVVTAALLVTAATPHVASSADTSPANGSTSVIRAADNVAASVVTLITGDRVTVGPRAGDGPGTLTVQGPNGEPTGARVLTVGGDTYVYPDSARPYLASGALDDQLFNISRLVADGYDDAALKHLPLIVTYGGKEASVSTLRRRAVAMPGDVTDVRPLTSVNGVAFAADRKDIDTLWSALTGTESDSAKAPDVDAGAAFHGGVAKVWLDGRAEATLSDSVAPRGLGGRQHRGRRRRGRPRHRLRPGPPRPEGRGRGQ